MSVVPNNHKHIFRFKFCISVKAVPKTKLFDRKITRTIYMKIQPSRSQLRDPMFQN